MQRCTEMNWSFDVSTDRCHRPGGDGRQPRPQPGPQRLHRGAAQQAVEKTDALLEKHGDEGDFVRPKAWKELVDALEKPRRVLIMVKAGKPVDSVIE